MKTHQRDPLIEAAGGGKRGTDVKLTEPTVKIGAPGPNRGLADG
jgi:hypothetical protein